MNLKSIAFGGVAVVMALVLSLGLMVKPASAATVSTVANGTASTSATGTAFTLGLTLTAAEMQNTQTLILTAPAGFRFVGQPSLAIGATPATTLTVAAAAGVISSVDTNTCDTNSDSTFGEACGLATNTSTWTATANNNAAAVLTITGFVRYAGGTGAAIQGNFGVTGTGIAAPITNAGTLAATWVAPYAITVTTTPSGAAAGIAADGSVQATLNGTAVDANSVRVPNIPIAWSVSLGVVSTGTSKTTTSFTSIPSLSSAGGVATTNYRGGGNVSATDTVIASNSANNAVGTLSITLTTATGTTAAKIAFNSATSLAVAATVTNTSPNYQSPTFGTNLSLKVTDASGLGVNNQTILVTTDKGNVANGFNQACGNAKAVSPASATQAPNVGGTAEAGIIQLTYCANQTDAPGKATLTAQNVSTTMANATTSISMAGRPAKVEATATGNAISVKVTDAGGNNVADGTPVRFTMGGANSGNVSTGCTTTTNGQASAVAALAVASANVLVSVDYNETGSVPGCAAAVAGSFTPAIVLATGAQQLTASVTVPGGTASSGTPSTPSAGSVTSGSVPAAGGFGFFVYGGPVSGLAAATGCPAGTAAFWATVAGEFVTNVPGTTISAVNAAFNAAFPNGIPAGTALLGKCK